MPPYDDWNRIDDEEDEELQDASLFEGKRDVILFCIDCSASMHELYDDPRYEGEVKTCHLYAALDAAMQIQKRKVIVGPNDAVGILLFNTAKMNETRGQGSEIKKNTYLYQPIATINAPTIQEIIRLLEDFKEDTNKLREAFPPLTGKTLAMGDVFTSCNWVIRDGAPKTASKRVFLITDSDDPHSGASSKLVTSARTTLIDLTQAGVAVEPFFISTADKPFDVTKFYSSVLLPNNVSEDDDLSSDSTILPESISISRIDDLLAQMRFHEIPKRALFNLPFELAEGFVIGVKGYGLVTEQKKGAYKYFVDLGEGMEIANVRTIYVDEDREAEIDRSKVLYGMSLNTDFKPEGEEEAEANAGFGARVVQAGQRPFYTAEDIRSFRTLGLKPMIRLLGFKDRSELRFEDSIKHSQFIYPDETNYSGSKRTFSALLKTMIAKHKIGIVLSVTRRNATPTFCALLPQAERIDESGWNEPAGFYLIPLPFADDIRAAPVERAMRAPDNVTEAARKWMTKLCVKSGGYPPDSYPNPALAYHNAQLEASAFREEYDPETFEDLTLPKLDIMHKRAGKLIKEWKQILAQDESANTVIVTGAGSKRKADVSLDEAEIRSKYDAGRLDKLRVDQLKEFLKSKSQPYSGRKGDLVERVADWLDSH